MTKSYDRKDWLECRECKKDDPCLMYLPKAARKAFPKNYCYKPFIDENSNQKGRWKKPEWAKARLTP
jgi:hypothetical protein